MIQEIPHVIQTSFVGSVWLVLFCRELSDRDPRLLQQSLKGGQTAYSLSLATIIEEAKLKEMQAHICQRFGHNGESF